MIGNHKIAPDHLRRKAIVYLRQSTDGQVRNNKESQALQYALVDKAKEMGFEDIEVIDVDLGLSASVGSKQRPGFERLLGAVARGQVGIVLSREVSRFSRTEKDWARLIEMCQLFDTLIGDADTVYDATTMDDQLILGIKGTLSVVELKILRLRLQQGRENKAKRGEYYPLLPPGYVWNDAQQVNKDPNLRVQKSIIHIFEKFREIGSIRQTFLWFHENKIEMPVNKPRGGKHKVVFQRPTHSFIRSVLRNPFYAGAYVWGQRPMRVVVKDGVPLRKQQASPCPPDEAQVFIRDHHEEYIDWETYEENLQIMRRNNFRTGNGETPGAARSGLGLLAGLLRCGHCGRRIYVRYSGKKGTHARYLCSGTYGNGGRYCLGFAGRTTDQRFGEEILRVLSPHGLRASLKAMEQLDAERDHRVQLNRLRNEQLQYEVTRAFEQYDEVDPRNRLVAQELERRWNTKLRGLDEAKAELAKAEQLHQPVTTEERQRLIGLGKNFETVWAHPKCSNELKKKIIRALIEEAVVREEPKGKLEFVCRWKGGTHTTFVIDKPISPGRGKTAPEDVEIIQKMAPTYGDPDIAMVLNRLGRRTARGNPWNQVRVRGIRGNYKIAGHDRTPEKPDILSMQGAARYCGVSDTTITRLVEAKLLPMKQVVACAPWEIERADLDAEPVCSIIAHLKRTGRLVLEGGPLGSQEDLFSNKTGR